MVTIANAGGKIAIESAIRNHSSNLVGVYENAHGGFRIMSQMRNVHLLLVFCSWINWYFLL
jgi:hypothetical protein